MPPQPLPVSDWRKQRYIEWLCTAPKDREPTSRTALGEELGVDRRTLTNWQNDADFLKEWERVYLKTIGSPERKQQIMDTLYKTATDPDDPKHVTAAKEYFAIEGSVRPNRLEVQVSKSTEELTDAELEALLASAARSEVERRQEPVDD